MSILPPEAILIFHHNLDYEKFVTNSLRYVRNRECAESDLLAQWEACRILIGAKIDLLKEIHESLAGMKQVWESSTTKGKSNGKYS